MHRAIGERELALAIEGDVVILPIACHKAVAVREEPNAVALAVAVLPLSILVIPTGILANTAAMGTSVDAFPVNLLPSGNAIVHSPSIGSSATHVPSFVMPVAG